MAASQSLNTLHLGRYVFVVCFKVCLLTWTRAEVPETF